MARDFSEQAFWAAITVLRKEPSSNLATAAMVVPAGEQTASLIRPDVYRSLIPFSCTKNGLGSKFISLGTRHTVINSCVSHCFNKHIDISR